MTRIKSLPGRGVVNIICSKCGFIHQLPIDVLHTLPDFDNLASEEMGTSWTRRKNALYCELCSVESKAHEECAKKNRIYKRRYVRRLDPNSVFEFLDKIDEDQ